jgi:hypothetical protein
MSEIKQTAFRLLELAKVEKKANEKNQTSLEYRDFAIDNIESIIKWALEMEKELSELKEPQSVESVSIKRILQEKDRLARQLEKCKEQRDKWVYECTISERMNSSMYEKRVAQLDLELEGLNKPK